MMSRRAVLVLAITLSASCKPPSAKAVDDWLTGYAALDVDAVVANTWSGDQALVAQALEALQTAPTSTLAMALPPRPIEHELLEIERKSPGRHTIAAMITMKNPLAFSSKRVGQEMLDIPETRPERRRFLSIQEGDRWGVKLDLATALARLQFVSEFDRTLAARRFDDAKRMLRKLPKPPDEANALRAKDRLAEALTARLEKLQSKAAPVQTSTPTAPR